MTPLTSFEKLLAKFVKADVRFLTVGGLACAMCGFVRTTEDVDILVARDSENLEKMLGVLRGFGEGHARELNCADFPDEEGAVRVVEDFPVDIFVRMCGHAYEDMVEHRRWHQVKNVRIPFLGRTGLIALKKNSYREKDKLDVAALRSLPEDPPNMAGAGG